MTTEAVTHHDDTPTDLERWRRYAEWLALFTIVYNLIEGVLSVWMGAGDETLALFGFGVDSFVEMISGIGILHMIRRQRAADGDESPDHFEQTALRITGWAMMLLAAGLVATGVLSLYEQHAPHATWWGVGISSVSILTMWALIWAKRRVGHALNSPAMLADAKCNLACVQFSVVLLLSSGLYEWTGVGGFDAVGALLIALLCVREGRESFNEAKGIRCGCHGGCETKDA
ncbi:MAG: hypothetical protein GC159_10985 [Phycisphaera sp.]|nr:hypothetical protein [Phycisphaera sp.]